MANYIIGADGKMRKTNKSKKDLSPIAPIPKTKKEDEEEKNVKTTSYIQSNIDEKKAKKEEGWFKSGAFSDGYQFGDIVKTYGSTILDLDTNMIRGITQFGEGITDQALYTASDFYDLLGNTYIGLGEQFSGGKLGILKSVGETMKTTSGGLKEKAKHDTTGSWFNPITDKLTDNSLLANESRGIAQNVGQAGALVGLGYLGGAVGLGSAGTTALTTGTTFSSSYGNSRTEAYENDATDEEARKYATAMGTIDAVTELLFGGLGKVTDTVGLSRGIGGLDDILAEGLTKGIKNQTVRNVAQGTVKMVGEGAEEVIAGYLGAHAQKGTYRSEEDFDTLLKDQQLGKAFLSGALVSGLMQGGGVIDASTEGRDYVSGRTQNEQKVIKNLNDTLIEQAEQENGRKLTLKERNKIANMVDTMLERGEVDIDTIESLVAEDSYKSYSTLKTEAEEFEKLRNTKMGELSDVQQDRLNELKTKNTEKSYADRLLESRTKLTEDVRNATQNDFALHESFAERGRRGEKFTVSEERMKQYSEKERAIVQKAIDYGELNNTRKAHEFVDLVAKLSADKDIDFEFTNNERLKNSGFALEGKTINGFKDGNKITVNLQSKNALNTVVGHEITHVLEGTELYDSLQSTVIEYAKQKGVYDSKYNEIVHLYREQFEGKDTKTRKSLYDAELTADLVGEYIFSDIDFVRNLSMQNINLFQKAYGEIKYFLKSVKAGSDAERQLLKAKKIFEEVYRGQSTDTNEDVRFSIREEAPPKNTKKAYKLMRYVDGKYYPLFIGNNEAIEQGVWYNADSPNLEMLKSLPEGTHMVDMESGESMTFEQYIEEHVGRKNDGTLPRTKPNADDIRWANENGYRFMLIEDKSGTKTAKRFESTYGDARAYYNWGINGSAKSKTGEGSASLYALRPGWHFGDLPSMRQIGYQSDSGAKDMRLDNQVWVEVEMSADVDYNEEARSNYNGDIPTHIPKDGYYEFATNPTQKKTKSGDSANDKSKGNWYVSGAFKIVRPLGDVEARQIVDKYNQDNGTNVPYDYSRANGRVFNADTMKLEDGVQYSVSEAKDNKGRTLTKEQQEMFKDSKVRDENGNLLTMYHGTPNGDYTVFKDGTYFTSNKEYADVYQNQGASSLGYKKTANNPKTYEVYLNIKKPFDTRNPKERAIFENEYFGQWGMGTPLMESGLPDWMDGEDLREFLEENGYDYDGLILDEGGVGGYGDDVKSRGFSYVVFIPNQVKNVDNTKPTNSEDIRYSVSKETETEYLNAIKNGDKEKAQYMVDKVAKENGYTKRMFHETSAENIHIFDLSKNTHGGTDSETPYGIFTKSTDKGIGLGGKQMALYVKADNTLVVDNREDVKNKIPQLVPYYDELKRIDTKYDAMASDLEDAEFEALEQWINENPDADMDVVFPTQYIIENKPADIDSPAYHEAHQKRVAIMSEWSSKYEEVATKCKDLITSYLKDNGYDSMYFFIDEGSRGRQTDSLIVLNENQVKSANTVTYDDNGNVIPLSQRFNAESNDIRYSLSKGRKGNNSNQYEIAPTFYSHMGRVIDGMKQNKMGAKDVLNYLTDQKRGVKAEEIKWSGIEEFLEGKKSVTKAELQEFVAGSQLQIEESTISDDNRMKLKKISRNELGLYDGKNLVETFVKSIDEEDGSTLWSPKSNPNENYLDKDDILNEFAKTKFGEYKIEGGKNYRELLFKLPNSEYSNEAMRRHWGRSASSENAKGILAHARIQDVTTKDGKKMLFIEEIQSDWHNEGHKKGYVTEENGVVEDAPFKNNYHEFVLKRLIRMASEQGYDSIGWTPAEMQSNRWSDNYAEGYRIEYDQDIPSFLKKYGKKWGATVGSSTTTSGHEVWSMDITDSMRDSVINEGQPMYSVTDNSKPLAPTPNGIYAEDIALEQPIAPIQSVDTNNMMQEEIAPTSENVATTSEKLAPIEQFEDGETPFVEFHGVDTLPLPQDNVKGVKMTEAEKNAVDDDIEDNVQIADGTKKKSFKEVKHELDKKLKRKANVIARNFIDKGAVFETLSKVTGNRMVEARWDFMLSSDAQAQWFMRNGGENVKSLDAIRQQVESKGNGKAFHDYMYHLLNIDRMTLQSRFGESDKPVFNKETTSEVSQRMVEKFEQAHPEFKDYAQDVYDYMNLLRNGLVKNGIITQETADLWSKKYPHYIPINRKGVGDEFNFFEDNNKTGVNAPIKRATGGDSEIEPLFNTIASRTIQTYKAINKNSFGIELMDTLNSEIIETLDAEQGVVVPNGTRVIANDRGNIGTIQSYNAENGTYNVHFKAKNGNEATVRLNASELKLLKPTTKTELEQSINSVNSQEELLKAGENGKNPTFSVFRNGERVNFEITKEMYEALLPQNQLLSDLDSKVLQKASSLQRAMLTEYNPVFALTNGIKDIQDVFINSQHARKTFAKMPEAVAQIKNNGYYYQEWLKNGGEAVSLFDSQTKEFAPVKKGVKKVVTYPLDRISDVNNYIEKIPRLAEYIASREMGRSIEESMLDASRVTTNFKAGGDITKWANRNGFTFLNASVQGLAQQVRNFREAHHQGFKGYLKLASKFALAGVLPNILNKLLWDDDEEYEELADYVKQNYYVIAKYGDGNFIRIPKGRMVGVIQDAVEQMDNLITGDDEADFNSFAQLVITNLAPNDPLTNNVFAPIKQAITNQTWYGEELVPQRLQDMPVEEQYDESTDIISRKIGETLGISPMKVNYVIDQYSGILGDFALPYVTPEATDDSEGVGMLLAPLKKKFTTDGVMNKQSTSDFYDMGDELTLNANKSTATDEDILKNKYFSSVRSEVSELYTQKREIQNSNLSKKEKYEQVREVQEQINELMQGALKDYEDVEVNDSYSRVSDRHYRKNDDGEWQKINDKQYAKQKKVTQKLDITANEYWSNKEEYDYAYDNPTKYDVAKAVGGYDKYKTYSKELSKIKSDKNVYGNTISGSRKTKVVEYLNNLNVDYYTKIMLYKAEYPSDDTYNAEIVEYLNNRSDISYEEMVNILTELGFKVSANGTVRW